MTSSPLQLGYVGLMMFIPGVLLLLVVGHVVDRYNRRKIILCAQFVMAVRGRAAVIHDGDRHGDRPR